MCLDQAACGSVEVLVAIPRLAHPMKAYTQLCESSTKAGQGSAPRRKRARLVSVSGSHLLPKWPPSGLHNHHRPIRTSVQLPKHSLVDVPLPRRCKLTNAVQAQARFCVTVVIADGIAKHVLLAVAHLSQRQRCSAMSTRETSEKPSKPSRKDSRYRARASCTARGQLHSLRASSRQGPKPGM